MDGGEIIGLLAVLGVIVLPSLAIAVRLSLKPMVEAIVRLHQGLAVSKPTVPAGEDVAALRAQVERLEAKVESLAEAEAFYRALGTPDAALRGLVGSGGAVEEQNQRGTGGG
jgi:hypothetical protein